MCDCESPQAFRQYMRVARKQHKCCECCKPIERGQQYEYTSGVWDGRGDSFKTCLSCVRIRAECEANGSRWEYYCTPCFGELADEAREQGIWSS